MTELEEAKSALRTEIGRALGFVVGSLVLSAQDGRLPRLADVHNLLEHYRKQFKAFTPEVEEIVKAVTDGLAFAARDSMEKTQL